jgi:hypothetical protein
MHKRGQGAFPVTWACVELHYSVDGTLLRRTRGLENMLASLVMLKSSNGVLHEHVWTQVP